MTAHRALRIGTRGSALARAQSGTIASLLGEAGIATELVVVSTRGDRSNAPIEQIGGAGVFVSGVRDALIAGRCDVAVHSLKDLPVAQPPGIIVAAISARVDPRDALCARDGLPLSRLPADARVGTGSARRRLHLLSRRPDLRVEPLRGNVDSRLQKVADGELDAVVLAVAGLARLGRIDAITDIFDPVDAPYAPGQGALAIECRANDAASIAALARLDDATSRLETTAERAVLERLDAGCTAALGAWARAHNDRVTVHATLWREADAPLRATATAPSAAAAGGLVAGALLAQGAGTCDGIGAQSPPPPAPPNPEAPAGGGRGPGRAVVDAPLVAAPIPSDGSDRWSQAVRAAGAIPVPIRLLRTDYQAHATAVAELVADLALGKFDQLFLTSARTIEALQRTGADLRDAQRQGGFAVEVIGSATAAAATRAGFEVTRTLSGAAGLWEADGTLRDSALDAWQLRPSSRIAIPASARTAGAIAAALEKRGHRVRRITAYQVVLSETSCIAADEVSLQQLNKPPDAVVLTSPSSARSWERLHPLSRSVPVVALGPVTARAVCELGMPLAATAVSPDAIGLAAALNQILPPLSKE
ncbi:hydroxymethylbilane synthase [Rarobacter incanus]|uniref:Porphobilinogen deaminase n=1 Tax=Rarobacter incanus TaxID=153494 RepID=A0A542SQH6_9MICO|nr:hydroxymethylbilane synthase [Rarobacter incanus]TQK76852.1 hydroxymethylbilane synthase [Rarobacter incanus]